MMNEWSMRPSIGTVARGPITFEVANTGQMEHEMVILRTDLAANALKMEPDEDLVDEDASGQKIGELEEIEPGETKTGSFQLSAGHYVLVCNIEGHYRQGLSTAFDVT